MTISFMWCQSGLRKYYENDTMLKLMGACKHIPTCCKDHMNCTCSPIRDFLVHKCPVPYFVKFIIHPNVWTKAQSCIPQDPIWVFRWPDFPNLGMLCSHLDLLDCACRKQKRKEEIINCKVPIHFTTSSQFELFCFLSLWFRQLSNCSQ